MNGYIKKQALMDYCSNQVTRTIDLNDIARFPIAEVFTKDEVIAMLTDLQKKMEEYEPKWVENDEQAVASCRTWEDLDGIIQEKINALREFACENTCDSHETKTRT